MQFDSEYTEQVNKAKTAAEKAKNDQRLLDDARRAAREDVVTVNEDVETFFRRANAYKFLGYPASGDSGKAE